MPTELNFKRVGGELIAIKRSACTCHVIIEREYASGEARLRRHIACGRFPACLMPLPFVMKHAQEVFDEDVVEAEDGSADNKV